jgi:DNA helicase-2/ATP-dependent DNA helicase PcrA
MLERFNRAKASLLENEYKYLNPEQKEAVFAPQNGTPLILCAGAGTGKTTTIVNKIAYLIKYGDAFSPFDSLPAGVTEETILKMENAAAIGQSAGEFRNIIAKNPLPSYSVLAVTFTNKAANEMKERISQMTGPYAEDMWIGTFHSICVKI